MLQEFVLTRERFEFEKDATKGSNRYSGFHSQGAKIVAYGLNIRQKDTTRHIQGQYRFLGCLLNPYLTKVSSFFTLKKLN